MLARPWSQAPAATNAFEAMISGLFIHSGTVGGSTAAIVDAEFMKTWAAALTESRAAAVSTDAVEDAAV
eukprot:16435154-Heterocapsa_arctica.AAC.2